MKTCDIETLINLDGGLTVAKNFGRSLALAGSSLDLPAAMNWQSGTKIEAVCCDINFWRQTLPR